MIEKKNDLNSYFKIFYEYKNDKVYKKSFLIRYEKGFQKKKRYQKTIYIKKDKLFDSFNISSSIIYLLRDVNELGKLENIHH